MSLKPWSVRKKVWTAAIGALGSVGLIYAGLMAWQVPVETPQPAIALPFRRPDTLPYDLNWQAQLKDQVNTYQGQSFATCLFGDSISSMMGASIGDRITNFAMSGLSTVSLVEQLKQFQAAKIRCHSAILEIGTNDAWYIISDQDFVNKLRESIQRVRSLGAQRIVLLPAFYSTEAASHDASMAGPLSRVDEINHLMQTVAQQEQVAIAAQGLESLYKNGTLQEQYTVDGVHLNDAGQAIYRQFLTGILAAQK